MISSEISSINFLNRLHELQSLCSSSNPDLPNALLFILSADGRFNKGSYSTLKYLFFGSVGKDIIDGFLGSEFDSLDDSILLIQEASVSVFYSSKARFLIKSLLATCPVVLEYCTNAVEDEDVDLFEARKCVQFKRMILESLPEGSAVGIPVPVGYDEVQETESWPMLQAFALDDSFCATGFFSARYAIVDITEQLEVIFRAVDGYYVDKAVEVLHKNILPHALQTIGQFETHSSDQRMRISVDTALSPLDLLFDYGSLEAGYPVDPEHRPVLLLSAVSRFIGSQPSRYPSDWRERFVGDSVHFLVEASEPSTGIRWCRTYFLAHGREVLLPTAGNDSLLGESASRDGKARERAEFNRRATLVSRLREVYLSLSTSLRYAVKVAFGRGHANILEAGSDVKRILEECQRSSTWMDSSCLSTADSGAALMLADGETLQVHMDCMDGFGQTISVEDVTDMGGQCWTFFRLAVHGITGESMSKSSVPLSVAVGDMFLFSPGTSVSIVADEARPQVVHGLLMDKFCLTHVIPYHCCFVGPGLEETAAQRLLTWTRSPSMSAPDGPLRPNIGDESTADVLLPIITDSQILNFVSAEMKLHSRGLLIQRVDNVTFLPIAIDIALHVESVWTVDSSVCEAQVEEYLSGDDRNADWTAGIIPDGLFIVFKLKAFIESHGHSGDAQRLVRKDDDEDDDRDLDGVSSNSAEKNRKLAHLNPLAQAVDLTSQPSPSRHLALFIESGSREINLVSKFLSMWRRAFRAGDIPEYKGKEDPLPASFIESCTVAMDNWAIAKQSNDTINGESADAQQLLKLTLRTSSYPLGLGYRIMKYSFAISERFRRVVCRNEDDDSPSAPIHSSLQPRSGWGPRAVVVMGMPGSGVLNLSHHLHDRLRNLFPGANSSVKLRVLHIDLSTVPGIDDGVREFVNENSSTTETLLTVIAVVAAPTSIIPSTACLESIRSAGVDVRAVLAVCTSSSTFTSSDTSGDERGLGREAWVAAAMACRSPGTSDYTLIISKPDEYVLARVDVEDSNPYTVCERRDPGNLTIDDELLESINSRCMARDSPNWLTNSNLAVRITRGLCNRATSPRETVAYNPNTGPSLRKVLCAFDESTKWDSALIQSCLRKLFPEATASFGKADEAWTVPPNHDDSTGLKRAIFLAKVKVFSHKQRLERIARLDDEFAALPSERLSALRTSLLSVQGVINAGYNSRGGSIVVDASSALIAVRQVEACNLAYLKGRGRENCLIVHGIFDDDDESFIENLLLRCSRFALTKKSEWTSRDVSLSKKLALQAKYLTDPLPFGWFFDGQDFIDCDGNRTPLRPDVDVLVDRFLRSKNESVRQYNQILQDVRDFI